MVAKKPEIGKTKKKINLSFLKNNKKFIVILVFLLLAFGVYYFKSLFVAATVNGLPIRRYSVINQLEDLYGQQVLDSLITKELIKQEARNKNITVNDSELDQEISNIEKQFSASGQSLDDTLALQNMSRETFREQIFLQKLVEKLLGDKINVADEEVDKYIEENKEFFPEGSDSDALREDVFNQLKQDKLSTEFQTWIQEIRQNSSINYFVEY